MNFYEKRPQYQAAQFDGSTDSVKKIQKLGFRFDEYTIGASMSGNVLSFVDNFGRPIVVRQTEWVVLFYKEERFLQVMGQRAFEENFERVPLLGE